MNGTWQGWRRGGAALALFALLLCLVGTAWAEDLRYLRIGTGPPGESHFPMGGVIAGAVSNPPGSRPCERGGGCGVPGLIAVASATNGSTFNAQAIGEGRLDAALIQADVAMWAFQGAPPFEGQPIKTLRSVANLYLDDLHVVARRDAHIRSVRDLKGKRVSLGEKGSGTLVHAKQVLAAWGLKETDVTASYVRSAIAADAMATGKLDAFFVLDGAPVPSVAELAKTQAITLVPLTGEGAEKLRKGDALLHPSEIPADTYPGVDVPTPTLSVGVSLVVSSALPEELVYALCKALWNPATTQSLADSQPQGAQVKLANALTGLGLLIHPGAERFYRDNGMVE